MECFPAFQFFSTSLQQTQAIYLTRSTNSSSNALPNLKSKRKEKRN